MAGSGSETWTRPALSERQKKFILAREIGYQVLGLADRAMTSAPERVDSFEQVLNDFKASYFAGALLINRERLLVDIKEFFSLERWQPRRLREFLPKYEVTPEIFMYRLTEVLPQYLEQALALAGEGQEVVLTGAAPVWLYLSIAHALHGKAKRLIYRSPVTGDVVIFDHDPF